MNKPEIETEVAMETFTKKKLINDLKEVVNDAEELLKKAAFDQTREWVATAQAKAKKSLAAANDWIAEEEGALTAKARSTAKAAEDYVQANTWKILGMAAMAGVVVGLLAVRLGLSVVKQEKGLGPKRVGSEDDGKRLEETGEEVK
jgi:ElaB/YqjD/DUF883 family membrane-anchored ribosome-binding protein